MDTLADTYYASSFRGEMGSADFNKALQDWLNEQTGGLLSDQTGSIELEPETVLALATTVYFRAKWTDEFQESGTEPGIFHAAGGDVTADFMHRRDSSSYYWAENFSPPHWAWKTAGACGSSCPTRAPAQTRCWKAARTWSWCSTPRAGRTRNSSW